MKTLVLLAVLSALASTAVSLRQKRDDGVRCRLTNGFLCKWSCRAFGHSGGECDQEDECRCSEETLERYVCGGGEDGDFPPAADALSDEDTADSLCAGYCQLKGKQTGQCDLSNRECSCSQEELEVGHAKCVSDAVCSIYCQVKERKAKGRCTGEHGWDCECISDNDDI